MLNLITSTLVLLALAAQALDLRVDAPPALQPVAARIEAIDRVALARSLTRAGLHFPPIVHLTLVADDDSPPWVVGQAFGNERIVIYPQRVGAYPYDSLEAVVLHEIVHLALTTAAGGRPLPRWFHEGVAVSVESGWGLASEVRLLLAAARDPGMDDISALFASEALPSTTTAYLLSAALVDDVRRRHGLDTPGLIAARVARGDSFGPAFLAVTGETVDEAASHAWRSYRGISWVPIVTGDMGVWGGILALAALAFIARVRRRRARRKQWEAEDAAAD
jgi:MYXO-CTERM domain-containing protein